MIGGLFIARNVPLNKDIFVHVQNCHDKSIYALALAVCMHGALKHTCFCLALHFVVRFIQIVLRHVYSIQKVMMVSKTG